MTKRQTLLESIATTIADYRNEEIPKPTPSHVEKWINQFNKDNQLLLLSEIDHVLKNTYFSREIVSDFLSHQIKNEKLAGQKPCNFWKSANFLDIQQHGHSQGEMLQLFDTALQAQCKLKIQDCGSDSSIYIYLDDALFSGSRVGNDLNEWLKSDAPEKSTVHIMVIASHAFGDYKVPQRVKSDSSELKKSVELHIWRAITIENRNTYRNVSEVLWPAVIPDDPDLQAYMLEEKKYPFQARKPGGKLKNDVYSSEEGRQLLEREMLLAGIRIRSLCQHPNRVMRPLGFSPFGLGFGSMIVTFRNCPNNCPLALWWGDPAAGTSSPLGKWYPLLPRKTYSEEIEFCSI